MANRLRLNKDGKVVKDHNLPGFKKGGASSVPSLSIDEKQLKRLAIIVGKTIARELLKHPELFKTEVTLKPALLPESVQYPQVTYDDIRTPDDWSKLEDIVDVGVSTEGMEGSFDEAFEEELVKDEGVEGAREKLSKLKSKQGV